MPPRIAIVDYEVGNLHSAAKAFAYVGCPAEITRDPENLRQADGVVFPGVGAFPAAMAALEKAGLVPVVRELALGGKPFFGICVGMQLLFDVGEEYLHTDGLQIIPGRITRLPEGPDQKLPQIGWNEVAVQPMPPGVSDFLPEGGVHPIFAGLPPRFYCYFVHSYAPDCPPEYAAATTAYGREFPSVVARGSVVATQFHPEKSSRVGLTLVANFVNLTAAAAGQPPCAAVPGAARAS